jgi:hypothetical protein
MKNKIVRLSLVSLAAVCFAVSVPVFSDQEIQNGGNNSSLVRDSGSDYSIVKIQDVQLSEVMKSGLRIGDLGKNSDGKSSYVVAFAEKNNCFNPVVSLLDDAGVTCNNPNLQIQTSSAVGGRMLWKIGTGVIETGSPTFYSVVFNEKSDNTCVEMKGSLPKVQISLTDAKQNGSKKLTLRNISSQSIEISNIKNITEGGSHDAINAEFNGVSISSITADQGVSIAAGEARDIVLKPGSICTFDEQSGRYKLEMEYKINGEISTNKFEVEINYSCDWELERIKKQLNDQHSACEDACKIDKIQFRSEIRKEDRERCNAKIKEMQQNK